MRTLMLKCAARRAAAAAPMPCRRRHHRRRCRHARAGGRAWWLRRGSVRARDRRARGCVTASGCAHAACCAGSAGGAASESASASASASACWASESGCGPPPPVAAAAPGGLWPPLSLSGAPAAQFWATRFCCQMRTAGGPGRWERRACLPDHALDRGDCRSIHNVEVGVADRLDPGFLHRSWSHERGADGVVHEALGHDQCPCTHSWAAGWASGTTTIDRWRNLPRAPCWFLISFAAASAQSSLVSRAACCSPERALTPSRHRPLPDECGKSASLVAGSTPRPLRAAGSSPASAAGGCTAPQLRCWVVGGGG